VRDARRQTLPCEEITVSGLEDVLPFATFQNGLCRAPDRGRHNDCCAIENGAGTGNLLILAIPKRSYEDRIWCVPTAA